MTEHTLKSLFEITQAQKDEIKRACRLQLKCYKEALASAFHQEMNGHTIIRVYIGSKKLWINRDGESWA